MDIQKSYSRETAPNYSYSFTEYYEYSSVMSVFDSILSIDQFAKSIMSTDPHSVKLTSKVKVNSK